MEPDRADRALNAAPAAQVSRRHSSPGIYIHIPFCEKKCGYCDFYSIEKTSLVADFLDALIQEIEAAAHTTGGAEREFSTVFFGGGTPSLLAPQQLEKIFASINAHYRISPDAEITVECNPGTAAGDKLRAYKALGVNRLSFGVQSFWEDELRFLGRIHSAEQAKQSVRLAQHAGFENVNIDLMFSLPGHTRRRWEHTLREAIALGTAHISAYSLIYEEGTPLYAQLQQGKVAPLEERTDAELFLFTAEFLAAHGFVQYEVSNFATPRRSAGASPPVDDLYACRHNVNYWRRGEYLGFGPSAHSFWDGERRWNYANIGAYLETARQRRPPVANRERIGSAEAFTEYISLGLRSGGIRPQECMELFHVDLPARHAAAIREYVQAGYLAVGGGAIRCTPKGYLWCDSLALEFLRNNEL